VSGHPLTSFEGTIKRFTNYTTNGLATLENGTQITIAGMLASVRRRITKNDKQMAFATLEDLEGSVDLVILSETLKTYSDMLQEGNIVWIKGAISNGQRDQTSVRVDEILTMDALRGKYITSVHVTLPQEMISESILKSLKDVCSGNKGECALFLHVKAPRYNDIVVQAHPDTKVAPTDVFIADMERIAGENSIWFDTIRSDYA